MTESKRQDTIDILRKTKPFSLLEDTDLEKLVPHVTRQEYSAETFVFRQGEETKSTLFLIIDGLAEISISNENAEDSVVGYRRTSEFFGETALLSDKPYPASVKAVTGLECLLIPRNDFELLLENNAGFASFFGRVVSDHFRNLFEEVSLKLDPMALMETRASWKRASELMSRPVITCLPGEKTSEIARLMSVKKISALVVTGEDGRLRGLVTEKDLVEKVVAESKNPDATSAAEIAVTNPVCVSPNSHYYQVLLEMIKGQAKHAIVAEQGRPIGIITIRDLIRSRNTGVITVINRLETQTGIKELASVAQEIDNILNSLVAENAPIPEILDIITEFYDRLTRQIINISMQEMLPRYGPAPAKFCWLTMGSGGRKEQFLRTDQDNALIYRHIERTASAKRAEEYFARLSDLVVNGLAECGFALCPGEVMASNPQWRGDDLYWKEQVSNWGNRSQNIDTRMLTIFLDFRPVYGHFTLAEDLRHHINEEFSAQRLALAFLAEDASRGKVPLGFLGKPVGERSVQHRTEIDLKTSASVHLVDCVRLLALERKANVTNTMERLRFLKQQNALSEDLLDLLETAFQTIMLFRFRGSLKKIREGKKPDNYLDDLKSLNSREKALLRDALKAVDRLMSVVRETHLMY